MTTLLGDAFARGKRMSTTADGPEFKKKNSRGKSHKTVDGMRSKDSGGDNEGHKAAKRSTKGMRPGTGAGKGTTVEPAFKRNSEGQSFQTIAPRARGSDSGSKLDAWCRGARKDYK